MYPQEEHWELSVPGVSPRASLACKALGVGNMHEELLPRDLIGAVVSKVSTAKQLCTILQLCKSWRTALTDHELEAIWERWVRQEYPRAVTVLELYADKHNEAMISWRGVYRDQRRAEAASAINFTNALDRLDSYVFTVEMRLDGELKGSWTGKGPELCSDQIDESGTEFDCILGNEARLWTSRPAWYSEFVQRLQTSASDPETRTRSWDGRLELTLFVSQNTAQGLRTGKLYQSRDAEVDDELEINFNCSAYTEGMEYFEGQPYYEVAALLFCGDDDRCGRIRFTIDHTDGVTDVGNSMEPPGSALARMIGKALGYP